MRASFVLGHPRARLSRRDRVGNSGKASKSRANERRRTLLPPLEELMAGAAEPDTRVIPLGPADFPRPFFTRRGRA